MVFLKRIYAKLHSSILKGAVTHGPNVPHVSLTFDDGPSAEWTPAILETLDRFNVKATFFVLGEQLEKHPDLARELHEKGHELASHLYSHDSTVADDDERFLDEAKQTSGFIAEITGSPPRFLRFPFAYMGTQKPRKIEQKLQMPHSRPIIHSG